MNLFGSLLTKTQKFLGYSSAASRKDMPRILLGTHATLSLQPCGDSQEVACRRGVLWITQEGNGRDIILQPGQKVTLRSRGRVLIEALKASSFSVSSLCGLRTV